MIKRVAALFSCLILIGCPGSERQDQSSFLGTAAGEYLRAAPYPELLVEIQVMSGFDPSTTAKNNLVAFLNTYLNKPAGITYVVETIPAQNRGAYSLGDIKGIEASNRRSQAGGGRAVAYFLFVDGAYAGDAGSSQTLGIAHGASSIVMFGGTIHALSGALGQPSRATLETTVMEHEFGHILGLVNVGTEMQTPHQDVAHGAHCTNTSCLMYYGVDTSDFVGNLIGGSVPTLDAACVADLRAKGGR